jgi:hypothetical protein
MSGGDRTKRDLRAENRELRAKLGWDDTYSEVAELREYLDRCRSDRADLEVANRVERESLQDREERFAHTVAHTRRCMDAFMQATEALLVLWRSTGGKS